MNETSKLKQNSHVKRPPKNERITRDAISMVVHVFLYHPVFEHARIKFVKDLYLKPEYSTFDKWSQFFIVQPT